MNIKSALKKIISALGGTPTGKNIPGLIDEISENVSGSGSGSSPLMILITVENDPSGGTPKVALDHTWLDIYTALYNNRLAFVKNVNGDISSSDSETGVGIELVGSVYRETESSGSLIYTVNVGQEAFFADAPDGYPSQGQ
jgi:hypothetical protein